MTMTVSEKVALQRNIPFNIPSIGDEEIEEVIAALKSGWITTGPRCKTFEKKFSEYVNSQYAIAVNSCTAALHLALIVSNISVNDEVITTPNTFAATAAVIVHIGAKPVFVDTVEDGFNIDAEKIESAITDRTKAILPVHFAGEPCDMNKITHIANKYNLRIIEDAAHALGATYNKQKIGCLGNITAFSFYATKNLTTGEGGMITTEDKTLAERMRTLSLHGLSRDAWKRYAKEGTWYYEIHEPGFKYNMSDIQAAIGLRQLAKFTKLQKRRKELAEYYTTCLSGIEEIISPPQIAQNKGHAWHLYVIRIRKGNKIDRDTLIKRLYNKGVGTSVHFIPLHLQPYYRVKFGYNMGDFPNAEKTYFSSLSLPLYPQMFFEDVEYISMIIKDMIK